MKKITRFIILGLVVLLLMLLWFGVIELVVKGLRGLLTKSEEPVIVDITMCDEDASDLCIATFGTNSLNRMVFNFQLPAEDYAVFYVKAKNRETVSVYTCEVDETTLLQARCTGVRTPLGEIVDIEVYTTDEDMLIARGEFLISALAIPTPVNQGDDLPAEGATEAPAPDGSEATEIPFPDGGEEATAVPAPDGGIEVVPIPDGSIEATQEPAAPTP